MRKRRARYIKVDGSRFRIPFHIFFTVMLIFAGGVGTAFSFAYLQDIRQQIEDQRQEIQRVRAENTATRAEITPHLPLEEVARIAEERLNMRPADPSQIILIYVPRQSYVIQSDERIPLQEQNMWMSAWQYIRNWFRI